MAKRAKGVNYARMTPTQKFLTLSEILSNVHGAAFISIDTLTDVPLRGGKANPFQGRVQKMQAGTNVMLFTNKNINGYESMVHRRLIHEGKNPADFVLSPRLWGTRLDGIPFVQHRDKATRAVKYYLEVIFLKPPVNSQILVDGEPFFGEVEGMIKATAPEQGGLDNKVVLRTYSVESIVAITIDGKTRVLQ